jgi:hypothetical protein
MLNTMIFTGLVDYTTRKWAAFSPLNIRPITMKMVLLDRKNHTILPASTNAGSTLMLGTRWGLSVVFVSLATLLIGVGEARSQAAQLQVCNQSRTYLKIVSRSRSAINVG